ncbi:MAG: DUF3347 domain-containing protein [Chitinophagaceae bacterium]
MKKLTGIPAILIFLLSCGGAENKPAKDLTPAGPVASVNDAGFNKGFDNMLSAYFKLRDGLIDWDTTAANKASLDLARYSDSLDITHFPNDSSGAIKSTADNFTGTITGSAKALVGEKDIQAKRKEFQMISDALYDLARSVRYDREILYHMKCPMAFNNTEEAYWISDNSEIKNPYLGNKHPKYKNKMLGCGEVTDSIGARAK